MTDIPAVKFVGDSEDGIVEGRILPMFGPAKGRDLTGTYFTKSTDFALDWFPSGGRPGLYAHGYDDDLGLRPIGREVKSWKAEDGSVWLRGQLDKAHAYWGEVKSMIDKGLLFLSSGSVDHLVQATKSGEIKVWPWVEWSLTPIPANPEAALGWATRSAPEPPDPIKSLPLTPQALHDAAVASGAACAHEPPTEPAPLLASAGKSAEPFDLDALADRLNAAATAAAIAAVKARLDP